MYSDDIFAMERAVKERLIYVKDEGGEFVPPPPVESKIAESFIGPDPSQRNGLGAIHNEVRSDIMFVRKSFMLPNGQIAEITEEYQVNVDPEQFQQEMHNCAGIIANAGFALWKADGSTFIIL